MIVLFALQLAVQSAISCSTDPDIVTPARYLFEAGLDSGSVKVSVWERDSIAVTIRSGDSRSVELRREAGHVVVCKRPTPRGVQAAPVSLIVQVPVNTRVQVNGRTLNVEITGVSGGAHVLTQQGDIDISDVSGRVNVGSLGGNVTLRALHDSTDVKTTAGNVKARFGEGALVVSALNGSVEIHGWMGRSITANSGNGSLLIAGPFTGAAKIHLSSDRGEVRVRSEGGLNATVVAGTAQGSWNSALIPVSGNPPKQGTRDTLVFGAGSTHIHITTFRGAIYVD